jgi:hypothetical protein
MPTLCFNALAGSRRGPFPRTEEPPAFSTATFPIAQGRRPAITNDGPPLDSLIAMRGCSARRVSACRHPSGLPALRQAARLMYGAFRIAQKQLSGYERMASVHGQVLSGRRLEGRLQTCLAILWHARWCRSSGMRRQTRWQPRRAAATHPVESLTRGHSISMLLSWRSVLPARVAAPRGENGRTSRTSGSGPDVA